MSKKQPKIKRYSSHMGKGYQNRSMAKKLVGFLLVLVVLLGAGYVGAPFIFNNIGKMWQGFKENSSKPPIVSPSPSAAVSATPSPEPSPSAPVYQTLVYCEVLPSELLTKEAISAKSDELKANGVTTAVITLKNPAGNLFFNSATELGKGAKGNVILDLALIAETFKANGISSCANIYTFMDKTAPGLDRSLGVKYVGTDYTWLDSAKELGGKPWASPASTAMQNYIYAISDEILTAGFREIIYSAVQLPTGYSLDKRDFGATDDQLLAQIKGFITTLQTRVTAFGARASFAFDLSSVNGGDYAKYLDAPTRLGAENIILTCQLSELAEIDLPAFVDKVKAGDSIDKLSVWTLDGDKEGLPSAFSGYFIK